MTLELVHRLATEESSTVRKILDNVIFVLVPSLNPDGQIMVTDWLTRTSAPTSPTSALPFHYHQ